MKTWIVPALALLSLMLFMTIRFVQSMPPSACRDEVRFMELTEGRDNEASCTNPNHTLTELPLTGSGFLFTCACRR